MKLFSDSLPFYRANFHCHTTNSDGRLSPEECVAFYDAAGYDILSITDHRTVTPPPVSADLLMIPGVEFDYAMPGQWVHILGLGMTANVAVRWNGAGTPQEGIDLIRALGGLAVLAHPGWSLNTPAFMRSLSGLASVEIWNSVSTLPTNGDRADSSLLLDVTWASGGELLPVFANDDSHSYRFEAGVGATMVQSEALTARAVLAALKAGRFYATTGPRIHQIEVRNRREIIVSCSPAQAIIFYSDCPWDEGRVVMGPARTEARYLLQENDHFLRVEVRDADGRKAWSAPIRIKPPNI